MVVTSVRRSIAVAFGQPLGRPTGYGDVSTLLGVSVQDFGPDNMKSAPGSGYFSDHFIPLSGPN